MSSCTRQSNSCTTQDKSKLHQTIRRGQQYLVMKLDLVDSVLSNSHVMSSDMTKCSGVMIKEQLGLNQVSTANQFSRESGFLLSSVLQKEQYVINFHHLSVVWAEPTVGKAYADSSLIRLTCRQ